MSNPNELDELHTAWDLFIKENREDLVNEYIQDNYKDFKEFCDDAFGDWCAEYQDVEKEKQDDLNDDIKNSLSN